jgi:hypothetical protein
MLTFLEINGYGVSPSDQELAGWIIDFSRGATPQQIADAIRPRLARTG